MFAIAVTLLAVQLRPPNLGGVTTVGGLLLLTMASTRITFLLVCWGVRAELEPGEATDELVMPALLRSAAAAVVLVALAVVVIGSPPFAGAAAGILVVPYLLAARLLVHTWQARHRAPP